MIGGAQDQRNYERREYYRRGDGYGGYGGGYGGY